MSEPKYQDFPLDDIVRSALEQLAENPNLRFFQKFTCANCGQRLSMDVANQFYKEGGCDKCGHVTNIEKQGCNYLMVATSDPAKFDEMTKRVREKS